jgi:hypothetical protein
MINTGKRLLNSRASQRWQTNRLLAAGILFGVALFLTAIAVSSARNSRGAMIFTAFMLNLPTAPVLLYFLAQYWRWSRKRIAIYENGLEDTRVNARAFYSWEDFDAFSMRSLRAESMALDLLIGGKRVVTIDHNTEYYNLLAQAAVNRVAESLLARYLEDLRQNKVVTIGPISLSAQGVEYQGRINAWPDIAEWRMVGNMLMVQRKSETIRLLIDLEGKPNVRLLAWLLDSIQPHQS